MNFVTGSTGLVGAHLLIHLLQHNLDVKALYRSENNKEKVKLLFQTYNVEKLFIKINWLKGDILDIPSLEDAMENVDYVYHCAAYISFDPSEYEILTKTNIEGTANVVNVALHKGIKKLCHVSSIAALGDPKKIDEVVNEETEWDPAKPHSDYALSKYGAEHEVFRGFQEGLDVVVINPGVILGAGFWHQGSGVLFEKIAKGLNFYSTGQTGFVSAWDVVKIMKIAMNSSITNERFIVISENKSFDEIAFKISDALDVKRPKIKVKPWMTTLGYKLDFLISKIFIRKRQLSRAMAKSMHSKEYFSNEKVINTYNFSFEKIDDIISQLAKIYKKIK